MLNLNIKKSSQKKISILEICDAILKFSDEKLDDKLSTLGPDIFKETTFEI